MSPFVCAPLSTNDSGTSVLLGFVLEFFQIPRDFRLFSVRCLFVLTENGPSVGGLFFFFFFFLSLGPINRFFRFAGAFLQRPFFRERTTQVLFCSPFFFGLFSSGIKMDWFFTWSLPLEGFHCSPYCPAPPFSRDFWPLWWPLNTVPFPFPWSLPVTTFRASRFVKAVIGFFVSTVAFLWPFFFLQPTILLCPSPAKPPSFPFHWRL